MPQVPHPDECETEIEHLRRIAALPDVTEEYSMQLIAYAKVRFLYISRHFKIMGC